MRQFFLKGIYLCALMLTACQQSSNNGTVKVSLDSSAASSANNGTYALQLQNSTDKAVVFNISNPGTNQYSVTAGSCNLMNAGNGYTVGLASDSQCDIILKATQNNVPGTQQFNLNITADGQSFPFTITINSYLYVGGEFTRNQSESTVYNHLAAWNGSSWSSIANGVNENVIALATDPTTGNLYAGGWFNQTTTGTPVNHIVMFNRNGAQALGSGVNAAVNSINFLTANNQDTVLVGGNFTKTGNEAIPLNYVASYSATNGWGNLDSQSVLTGPVRAVAADASGNIYVGAASPVADADNTFDNEVAFPFYKINSGGNQLSLIGYFSDIIRAILPANQGIFLGGYFHQYAAILGGSVQTVNAVALLNGSSLSQVGNASDFIRGGESLTLFGNTLSVSGHFLQEQVPSAPFTNPYGNMELFSQCNVNSNSCMSIGTPVPVGVGLLYSWWLYQVTTDNQGNVYAVVRYDDSFDTGPDNPYVYTTAGQWQQLGNTGFNHLAFSEALGSTINVS